MRDNLIRKLQSFGLAHLLSGRESDEMLQNFIDGCNFDISQGRTPTRLLNPHPHPNEIFNTANIDCSDYYMDTW